MGQKLRKSKIQQRVSPFCNTLRASEAASTLPGNGENVEKRKEGREEEKKRGGGVHGVKEDGTGCMLRV